MYSKLLDLKAINFQFYFPVWKHSIIESQGHFKQIKSINYFNVHKQAPLFCILILVFVWVLSYMSQIYH